MIVPDAVAKRLDPSGHPLSYLLERYDREREATARLLDAANFKGLHDVIDYGCCVGGWVWPIAERCGNVIGVDRCADYVDAAAQIAQANRVDNASFRHAASLADFPDASTDGIVSVGTLLIVDGAVWIEFMRDAARVLRNDGLLLINFGSPRLPLKYLSKLEGFSYIRSKGFRYAFTRQAMWARTALEALTANQVRPGRNNYGLRASAVESLLQEHGFVVEEAADMQRVLQSEMPANFSTGLPPYFNWLLCRRTAKPQPTRRMPRSESPHAASAKRRH